MIIPDACMVFHSLLRSYISYRKKAWVKTSINTFPSKENGFRINNLP